MRADEQKPDTRRQRRTSGQLVAKSISIKDAKRRSGGCAPKAIELTPGGLLREIRGTSADERCAARRSRAKPLVEAQAPARSEQPQFRVARTVFEV